MTLFLRLPAYGLYAAFVLEILFMISPVAVHFYSVHGPVMRWLQAAPASAWLTQFFLPHFSETSSWWLNALPSLGELLLFAGLGMFLTAAVPLYWAKWRGRPAVTRGPYALIRHPQYVGLAILGFGTVLLWPRFLVAVSWVVTCWLYVWLAVNEEKGCLTQFGEDYRRYQKNTGAILPLPVEQWVLRCLPGQALPRRGLFLAALPVALAGVTGSAILLRSYSLDRLSALWMSDAAILSVTRMGEAEMDRIWTIAKGHERVEEVLRAGAKLAVHVVPADWYLADLPIETSRKFNDHHTPKTFDRTRMNVLITQAVTHSAQPKGHAIVTSAIQRVPLLLLTVDTAHGQIIETRTPPQHVMWGDISTPFF